MVVTQTTRASGRQRTAAARALDRARPADLAWLTTFVVLLAVLIARNYVLGQTEIPVWRVGPIAVGPFGPLAVLDVLFGYYLIHRWCIRFGLDWETLANGLLWTIGIGYYASHVVSVALYTPEQLSDVRVFLSLRSGISSFGGILGGGIVAAIYLRRKGLSLWLYNDAILYGFIGGYIFGRLGCFAVHDHPGIPTDFVLGVDVFGAVRHDLGLYLMCVMVALFVALTWMARRGHPPPGSVVALVCITYPPIRFYLDGLRINDASYLGLTPGQWFCFPTFLIGLWAVSVVRRRRLLP
jgi:phosphatidylglycerol:prolipoprotein diacylglycerol transferase